MILDQVTDAQIRGAQIFSGATIVGFLAAPMFRAQARNVRMAVAGVYIIGVLGFIVFTLR